MIRLLLASCLLILSQLNTTGQAIRGQIIDSKTNKPLEYVSVGIINTSFGAITDDKGYFEFGYKDQDTSSTVRISMIGYEYQTFSIQDLLQNNKVIKLTETCYEIDEIVITPTVEKIIGANGFNKFKGWSGWNVRHIRKGCEIGIKLNLGDKPVKIKSLHVLLHRQAFDTTLYRLHFRRINDTLIKNELLTENIIVSITNESGWAMIDLEYYNLIFEGEIGVTLEMLNAIGLNEDRAMKINDRVQKNYILLKNKKNQTGLFRWGPEAKWNINNDNSPSIYLTIME
jgi:hypothetical protein